MPFELVKPPEFTGKYERRITQAFKPRLKEPTPTDPASMLDRLVNAAPKPLPGLYAGKTGMAARADRMQTRLRLLESPGLEDPWLDPTMAATAGYGAGAKLGYSAARLAGKGVLKAIGKGAARGVASAIPAGVMDYPIGGSAEAAEGAKNPELAWLLAIGAGLASGLTIENLAERKILGAARKVAAKYADLPEIKPILRKLIPELPHAKPPAESRLRAPVDIKVISVPKEATTKPKLIESAKRLLGDQGGQVDVWHGSPHAAPKAVTLGEPRRSPFKESIVQEPFYHGTYKKFDRFEHQKGASQTGIDFYGLAHYFTPDFNVAKQYSFKRYGQPETGSGEVKKVYLDIKHPVDTKKPIPEKIRKEIEQKYNEIEKAKLKSYEIDDDMDDLFDEKIIQKQIYYTIPQNTKFSELGKYLHYSEPEMVTEVLKKHGYDGYIYKTPGGQIQEVAVFDPNQIKVISVPKEATTKPKLIESAKRLLGDQGGQVDVWHGSPHAGIKAYDLNKVGTGEGVQAFGYGMYFTESKEVAKTYAEMGNSTIPTIKGKPHANSQNLYKTTLFKGKQPSEYTWLDWDKPVPDDVIDKIVKQAKKELGQRDFDSLSEGINQKAFMGIDLDKSGQRDYMELTNTFGSPKAASEFLNRAGIDGIRYPAGSLSGAKSEAKNYVLFDMKNATIDEMIQYGLSPILPILAAGGAGGLMATRKKDNNKLKAPKNRRSPK